MIQSYHPDYAKHAERVQQLIRERQKSSQDNSTQAKHNERCRIAVAVHHGNPYYG